MNIRGLPFCIKALAVMIAILFVAETGAAQHEITFIGKRHTKALLKIDGKKYRLKPGEKTPQGIELISVNKDEAVILIGNTKFRYAKGSSRGRSLSAKLMRVGGHFFAQGTINKKRFYFLVDTGATDVVLGKKHARRLNIRYRKTNPVKIRTAAKELEGYPVNLDSVGVGDVVLRNVDAVVLEGYTEEIIILGMSFLGSVKISYDGEYMILRQ
jgi:aspartyl protease family protein